MKRVLQLLVAGFWMLAFPSAWAANTEATLLLSHAEAKPGETVTAAVRLKMAPGWHTYWRNAGDAGFATSIDWELPPEIKAGEIQWPVPEKTVLLKLFSYSYDGEILLLIPLQISPDASPGIKIIKGKASWLECAETCIPADSPLQASLVIGENSTPSEHSALIKNWQDRLPSKDPSFKVTARWEGPPKGESRPLLIEWTPKSKPEKPDFYPYEDEDYSVEPGTEVLQAGETTVTLRKEVETRSEGKWPTQITGLILDQTGESPLRAYEVDISIPIIAYGAASGTTSGETAAVGASALGGAAIAETSLGMVLVFAFIGGLILNFMPCVLPVIALKILSFVNQSGTESRRARQLGLIYGLGVLTSFLVLAGVVIGVTQAGGLATWGMQYQSPVFLVLMCALVTLIALNLFGVFEITLGGKTLGAAGELASKEGAGGAFFNGVLATILGTSCTAPFLAAAIGYALGRSAYITILVFLMMGAGLAFPYVLLTWNPALMRFVPKPGAWMNSFKTAMGFPMLITALWLYGVAVKAHFGKQGAFWLGLFLVLIAVAAWIYGEFIQRGAKRRPLAYGFAGIAIALAFGFVLEAQLQWRNPPPLSESGAIVNAPDGLQWERWSPESVAKAREAGRPVLVDFTADWCLNCQLNKISSLEIDPVVSKLTEIGGVAMIADFTGKSPEIAQELRKYQRGAVPLVLVFPPDPKAEAIVLPPTLTPSIVLNALDQAAGNSVESKAATVSLASQEKD